MKLYNNYAKIISEAVYRTKQRTILKILTPQQKLQRLPIALAQVKASNNPKKLLNEIKKSVYSLLQSKNLLKVCNNIINSIQI